MDAVISIFYKRWNFFKLPTCKVISNHILITHLSQITCHMSKWNVLCKKCSYSNANKFCFAGLVCFYWRYNLAVPQPCISSKLSFFWDLGLLTLSECQMSESSRIFGHLQMQLMARVQLMARALSSSQANRNV